MTIDPSIYYAAIPAVLLVGLTKGGMGEALALLGVPILAMAVSPVQAAAILLPGSDTDHHRGNGPSQPHGEAQQMKK